jgi:hypothetical protein
MTPEQEAALTGGGDCQEHFHLYDQRATQALLQGLHAVASRRTIVSDTVLTGIEDFSVIDTSGGNVVITLPIAKQGLEIELLKKFPENMVIVSAQGTDTILNQLSPVTISSGNAAIRFKAFDTDWRPI